MAEGIKIKIKQMVKVTKCFKYDGTTESITKIWEYLLGIEKVNNTKYFLNVGRYQFSITYERKDYAEQIIINLNDYIVFREDWNPWYPLKFDEESFNTNLSKGSFSFSGGEKEELPLEEEPCIIELRLGESKMVYNSVTRLVTLFTSNGVCTNCEIPENWSYTRIFQFMDSLTKAEKLMV